MNINSLTDSFEYRVSFWEVNPGLKDIGIFKDIYQSDKSKSKLESSKLLWFVAYCYDMKSYIYNLPEADRIELICVDILEEPTFYKDNKDIIYTCKNFYSKLQDTPAMRQLRVWNKKMEEKTLFMENTQYDETTWEMLDKMQTNNVSAFKNYQQIVEMLSKEEAGSSTRGGEEPTLSDTGMI